MRISSRLLPFCLVALCLALPVGAEEKSGLQVSVQKVTLDRADVRGGDVNMENLDRLMALRVAIRNTSFKSMPESEVTWEILRRKYDDSGIELTSGVEKLPHLKVGEAMDVTWGIVKVLGYRNGAILRKDELEWELTFKEDGKEVAKFSSKPNFAMLLKRAVRVEPPTAPPPPATPVPAPPK